jgi:hypothetical protein
MFHLNAQGLQQHCSRSPAARLSHLLPLLRDVCCTSCRNWSEAPLAETVRVRGYARQHCFQHHRHSRHDVMCHNCGSNLSGNQNHTSMQHGLLGCIHWMLRYQHMPRCLVQPCAAQRDRCHQIVCCVFSTLTPAAPLITFGADVDKPLIALPPAGCCAALRAMWCPAA